MFITYKTYIVINKITGGIYIGCTKESKEARWESHLKKSKNPSAKFHKAIQKYGEENFSIKYLQTYLSEKDMLNGEIRYIRYFNSNSDDNYNSTTGGEGGATLTGQPHGNEWNSKISSAHAGKEQFHRRVPKQIELEIVEKYTTTNVSGYQLALDLGCKRGRIYDILERNKIPIKQSNYTGHSKPIIFTKDKELEIAKEYCNSKVSRSEIARKYGVGKTTMRDILLRNKVDLKNRVIK